MSSPPSPAGRFHIAFDDPALDPAPTWTRIDDTPNLLTSWTVDRGRQYELDRTDAARATVQLSDPDGVLDPTNPSGPFYGKIEPSLQACLCRWNPVAAAWDMRFRGWISDWNYEYDPSQQLNRLTLELSDIFEVLNAVEMLPYPVFGDDPVGPAAVPPKPEHVGQVFYYQDDMDERILHVLADAGIPTEFHVVFTGTVVDLFAVVYSVGESPLTAITEAADAEFPGVSNVYTDRFGRLAVHGRLAKFDPGSVAAGAGDAAWDWHHWHAGDGAAVQASPATVAHVRRFGFSRGLSKIINSAVAYPNGADDSMISGQVVQDTVSIAKHGIRSWSASNLLTKMADDTAALAETKLFAQYYVDNYAAPHDRPVGVTFRSMRPGIPGVSENWRLLSKIDISDQIDITISSPGGGGFTAEEFFVEGIHETSEPLNPDHDNDTVTLDLSPKALYATNPFP